MRRITIPLLPLLAAGALAGVLSAEDYSVTAPTNQRPMLGVEMTPVPTSVQDREGLDAHQGVLVQSVYDSTAASDMNLQKGDVILSVNGQPIGSMTDLRNEVGLTAIGDAVEVQVTRNGQVTAVTGTVKPWPDNIPYQKLDAEAEKRYRDWQDRRQQRLADDVQRMANETEKLRKQLTGEDLAELPARDPAEVAEDGPAFRFAYHIIADRLPAAGAPEALDVTPADFTPPPAAGPWRLSVKLPVAAIVPRSAPVAY